MKSQKILVKNRNKPTPFQYVKKQWFLFAIFFTIFLAAVNPDFGSKEGPLNPEVSVKYGAVCLIFFLSGLSLNSDNIWFTARQYKLHLFIQGFTFIVVPTILHVLTKFLGILGINTWILKGLVTVGCMPPPVSSAVILTRSAQGSEAAAIFNSVLGSFIGIIITPVLLLLNLGITTVVPLLSTVLQLGSTVLLPLLIGQLCRKHSIIRGYNLPLNAIGQLALLFIIYTTFCDAFLTHEIGLGAADILITIFLVVAIQVLLLSFSFWLAKKPGVKFPPQDVVAILFCSTHKSLTLGIPILRVMFHGLSHMGHISLPLLVYHPTQIMLGGMLAAGLKDWVHGRKHAKLPL